MRFWNLYLPLLLYPSRFLHLFSALFFVRWQTPRAMYRGRHLEGDISRAMCRKRPVEIETSRAGRRDQIIVRRKGHLATPFRQPPSSSALQPVSLSISALRLSSLSTRNSSRASCLDERVVRQTLVFNICPLFLHQLRSLFFFHSQFVDVESSRRNRRGRRFDERVI
jgi:hypothetical protein